MSASFSKRSRCRRSSSCGSSLVTSVFSNPSNSEIFSKISQYRCSAVRHADETRWRTDGMSGYCRLFATTQESLYLFGGRVRPALSLRCWATSPSKACWSQTVMPLTTERLVRCSTAKRIYRGKSKTSPEQIPKPWKSSTSVRR